LIFTKFKLNSKLFRLFFFLFIFIFRSLLISKQHTHTLGLSIEKVADQSELAQYKSLLSDKNSPEKCKYKKKNMEEDLFVDFSI